MALVVYIHVFSKGRYFLIESDSKMWFEAVLLSDTLYEVGQQRFNGEQCILSLRSKVSPKIWHVFIETFTY